MTGKRKRLTKREREVITTVDLMLATYMIVTNAEEFTDMITKLVAAKEAVEQWKEKTGLGDI